MLSKESVAQIHYSPAAACGHIQRDLERTLAPHVAAENLLHVDFISDSNTYQFTFGGAEAPLTINMGLHEVMDLLDSPQPLISRLADLVERQVSHLPSSTPSRDRARLVSGRRAFRSIEGTVPTDLTKSVATALKRSTCLLLLGGSAAGKTTATLQACLQLSAEAPYEIAVVDHAFGPPPVLEIVELVLKRSRSVGLRKIIVADNIQAQIESAATWRLLAILLGKSGGTLAFVAWPMARVEIETAFPHLEIVAASGDLVLRQVLANQEHVHLASDRGAIEELAGGDVFVGSLAADYLARNRRVPTDTELLETLLQSLGAQTLGTDQLACLYTICSINSLDIPVHAGFLVARHGRHIVADLKKRGLVRREGEKLRIGHKSRADLLRLGLHGLLYARGQPEFAWRDVVLEYLRTLTRSELFAVLQSIDAARAIEGTAEASDATYSILLRSINVLLLRLEQAQRSDHSWGGNLASAVFASLAFAWGAPPHNATAVAYVRQRVVCDGADLTFPAGRGREWDDFAQIQAAMIAFDATVASLPVTWERGEEVDLDIFYRNWMLGLLLCAEGLATSPDHQRRRHLIQLAGRQLTPHGGFYPLRVSWVTARILMGLSLCGETIDTSQTALSAATWLLSQERGGVGAAPECWPSGTGAWNSSEQCTAMCALALRAVGVPRQGVFTSDAIARLPRMLSRFRPDEDEIDILLLLECLAEFDQLGDDSTVLLGGLAKRYTLERDTIAANLNPQDLREESSKDPFVVTSMMNIMWDRVSASLAEYVDQISPQLQWLDLGREQTNQRQALRARILGLSVRLTEVLAAKKQSRQRARNVGAGAELDELDVPIRDIEANLSLLTRWGEEASVAGEAALAELAVKLKEMELTYE